MNTLTKVLIGAGVAVGAYQAWKMITKPKGAESKSSVTGGKVMPLLKYKQSDGKVYTVVGTGFDSRWVRLNEKDQPKKMDWYRLNDKWFWSKWNGKLENVPNAYILR